MSELSYTSADDKVVYDYEHPIQTASGYRLPVLHEYNDRLIDIVSYLPANLIDTELGEFVKLFQDFLNYNLYMTAGPVRGWNIPISVLKKIELLVLNRSVDEIDPDLLTNFAKLLGYDMSFTEESYYDVFGYDTDTKREESMIVSFLREVIRSLPTFYANKSTRGIFRSFMHMFGLRVDFQTQYSNDYENFSPEKSDGFSYSTPHFTVEFSITNTNKTAKKIKFVISTINRLKPIQTVFDGLTVKITNLFLGQMNDQLDPEFDWNPKTQDGMPNKYMYVLTGPTLRKGLRRIGINDTDTLYWDSINEKWVIDEIRIPPWTGPWSNTVMFEVGSLVAPTSIC